MSDDIKVPGAKIKVIGVGGGGGNAVNTMIRSNIEGVDFICCNTDIQALQNSLADTKIQIGKELTRGLGAGADPDVGRDAALEDRHALQESLEGANMVFVTAGMGGGTGTGGAAIVSQIAKDIGALTVAVVTKPFIFEGKRRRRQAEIGIQRLKEQVDTLITIPNQRLLQVSNSNLSMINAFQMADTVLVNAVRGISDIINVHGYMNVDFADVKTVMASQGMALMGIGTSEGENAAVEAAHQAISSPLLEDVDIEGAVGILINITSGNNFTVHELSQACGVVQDAAHEDANIIVGHVFDESLDGIIRVTVIATGFPPEAEFDEEFIRTDPKKLAHHAIHSNKGSGQTSSNFKKPFKDNTNLVAPSLFDYSESEAILPKDLKPKNASEADDSHQTHELTNMTLDNFDRDEFAAPLNQIENDSFLTDSEPFFKDNEKIEKEEPHPHHSGPQDGALERKGAELYTAEDSSQSESEPDISPSSVEAIDLVNRVKDSKTAKKDPEINDDLDVPAFLRNSMKDLPLS